MPCGMNGICGNYPCPLSENGIWKGQCPIADALLSCGLLQRHHGLSAGAQRRAGVNPFRAPVGAAALGGPMVWPPLERVREVTNRPWKFGPPSGGHGDSAPAGGLSSRDAPPVFFSDLRKRKRAVHGPKEKAAWTRSGAVTLRAQRGSAYRCLLRFGLAFGHAMLFCDSCCCRPVADGADLVGVVVAWSCFSFRYRSRSREESGSA